MDDTSSNSLKRKSTAIETFRSLYFETVSSFVHGTVMLVLFVVVRREERWWEMVYVGMNFCFVHN